MGAIIFDPVRPPASPMAAAGLVLPLYVMVLDNEAAWLRAAAILDTACEQGQAPVFAFPHWLQSAWCWRAPQSLLRLVMVMIGEDCAGFAPLMQIEEKPCGLPIRTLQFVAVPDTQFMDLVARPQHAGPVCAALARHLYDQRADWERLQLRHLSKRHGNWRILQQALLAAGIPAMVENVETHRFIDLTGAFNPYYAKRSRRLKKSVNLSANRLGQLGTVEVEWIRHCDGTQGPLAEAVRVSSLSWKQGTGTTLDQPGPRAFIEHLTAGASAKGQFSLWLLRLNGRAIATEYQLIDGGVVHALRSDFDPEFASASPGTYLNRRMMEQLFGAGLLRYYMGRGSNAYKRRWADHAEPVYHLTAYSPKWHGRLLCWFEQTLLPLLRRLRPARNTDH